MSLGQGQAHEAHFGPPSELINVAEFIEAAQAFQETRSGQGDVQPLSDHSDSIAVECRYVFHHSSMHHHF